MILDLDAQTADVGVDEARVTEVLVSPHPFEKLVAREHGTDMVGNRTRVKVDFIVFDRQARTWVVILISMALGALLAEVIRLAVKRRRRVPASRPDST